MIVAKLKICMHIYRDKYIHIKREREGHKVESTFRGEEREELVLHPRGEDQVIII